MSRQKRRVMRLEKLQDRLPLTASSGFIFENAITGAEVDPFATPAPAIAPVVMKYGIEGTSNDDTMSVWTAPDLAVNFKVEWTQGGLDQAHAGRVELGDVSSAALTYLTSKFNEDNPLVGYEGFKMEGLGGHDTLTGNGPEGTLLFDHLELEGGGGNDSLTGGAQNDELDGGSGEDVLDGYLGADKMESGTGNDRVKVDPFDPSPTDAGGGDDVLEGNNVNYPTRGINVSNSDFEEVIGTDQNDVIDSTSYDEAGWTAGNGNNKIGGKTITGVFVKGGTATILSPVAIPRQMRCSVRMVTTSSRVKVAPKGVLAT